MKRRRQGCKSSVNTVSSIRKGLWSSASSAAATFVSGASHTMAENSHTQPTGAMWQR